MKKLLAMMLLCAASLCAMGQTTQRATQFLAGNGSCGTPGFAFQGGTNDGLFWDSGNARVTVCVGGVDKLDVAAGFLGLPTASVVKWSTDTGLSRDAAGVVDVGNGTAGDKSGTILLAKLAAGGSLAGGSGAGDVTAARSTTSGAVYFGSDGVGFIVRNGASVQVQGTGPLTWTFPAATGTLARTSGDTFTSSIFTSPIINGTPTGTGIPTVTLKKGSAAGSYTTASTTYVVVDSTNLCYTVTIPTGWKLTIASQGSLGTNTAAVAVNAALSDNASCATANAGILLENAFQAVGAGATLPFNLVWAINGDGATHNIALQFKTSNGADSALLANSSSTFLPTMVFNLSPSN